MARPNALQDSTQPDFGRYAPDTAQRRLRALFFETPLGFTRLRRPALNALKRRGGPLDAELFGYKVRFHPDDNTSDAKAALLGRCFNATELTWLRRALPDGGVFVDVGANMGFFTLAAARRASRVVAIEPNPALFERLRFNLDLNGLDHVHAVEAALGETDGGTLTLGPTSGDLGTGTISATGEGRSVACRSLTSVLAQHGVAAVDVLKIDVEGYEDRVLAPFLASAGDALLPRSMLIEVSSRAVWASDLLGAMARRGYRRKARSRGNAWYVRDGR